MVEVKVEEVGDGDPQEMVRRRVKGGVVRRETDAGLLGKGCEYTSGSQPGNVAMIRLPLLHFCCFYSAIISALMDDVITIGGARPLAVRMSMA